MGKIVDRQSRWRPREERFDSLRDADRDRAAELADSLGRCLNSLRHLEGPVFVLLLRARGASATAVGQPDTSGSPSPPSLSSSSTTAASIVPCATLGVDGSDASSTSAAA